MISIAVVLTLAAIGSLAAGVVVACALGAARGRDEDEEPRYVYVRVGPRRR